MQPVSRAWPTTKSASLVCVVSEANLLGSSQKDQLSGEVEMDERYFGGRCRSKRGRGASGMLPVFGIWSGAAR